VDEKNSSKSAKSDTIKLSGWNPWGFLAFCVSTIPFVYFAIQKGQYTNFQIIRYTLVVTGFLGLFLGIWAFLVEKKGNLLSRMGVFLAIMGALLGSSIGVLASLPIILNLLEVLFE
jgi:hypothetical protein